MKVGTRKASSILRSAALGAVVAFAVAAAPARADVVVTVDPGAAWLGYMNVFDLGGGFLFGSPWGTADLTAVFSGSNLKLGPNTIGDPDPFWYIGGGGPGAPGNKIMEANMYVEQTGPFAGQLVTFVGDVLAHSFTDAHVARAFIRDFAPDFSSVVETSILLPTAGPFALNLNTINNPARHVQYGFQVKGVNVWVTDVAPFGSATIGPLQPTPAQHSTWGRVKALYR